MPRSDGPSVAESHKNLHFNIFKDVLGMADPFEGSAISDALSIGGSGGGGGQSAAQAAAQQQAMMQQQQMQQQQQMMMMVAVIAGVAVLAIALKPSGSGRRR